MRLDETPARPSIIGIASFPITTRTDNGMKFHYVKREWLMHFCARRHGIVPAIIAAARPMKSAVYTSIIPLGGFMELARDCFFRIARFSAHGQRNTTDDRSTRPASVKKYSPHKYSSSPSPRLPPSLSPPSLSLSLSLSLYAIAEMLW